MSGKISSIRSNGKSQLADKMPKTDEEGGGDEVMEKMDQMMEMIEQKCVPYLEFCEATDTTVRGKVRVGVQLSQLQVSSYIGHSFYSIRMNLFTTILHTYKVLHRNMAICV